MQVPILNGVYTSEAADFRIAYPRNMVPVAVPQGISNGYLRQAEGLSLLANTGLGKSRGVIKWNGVCYRVMGERLVSVDSAGVTTDLGFIGAGTDLATMHYSFDRLSISVGNKLYYYNGATLTQVTDPDLGVVLDHIWVDGYFMTTDGEFLVVTELADPTSVLPLKYGSSELDPDPVKALLKLNNEPYVLNRYTTEVFNNVGGSGFPFQRVDGAQLHRGVVGTYACCVIAEVIVFVGGGRDEGISVWATANGNSTRIATREIDLLLKEYTEATLAEMLVEPRTDNGHQLVYLHLPNRTLVYDFATSTAVGEPVWFELTSSTSHGGIAAYDARHLVYCYGKWLVADVAEGKLGQLSDTDHDHWGNLVYWQFSTVILYNEGRGALVRWLELVGLHGRGDLGAEATVWTQYSLDGETWSMLKSLRLGLLGDRAKRLVWVNQGAFRNWRIQRFSGTSAVPFSPARLEAQLEPLEV